MIIKVLGTGCTKCKLLKQKLEQLKSDNNLDFDLEEVTQLDEIMGYGIMMTPGLVIDEEVKSVGKVPKDSELLNWIREA